MVVRARRGEELVRKAAVDLRVPAVGLGGADVVVALRLLEFLDARVQDRLRANSTRVECGSAQRLSATVVFLDLKKIAGLSQSAFMGI